MRIVLGVPTYNEINFVDLSVSNAVSMGYDHVVYYDDGSTDGTFERLLDYASMYPQITVFRSETNSVLTGGTNRWKVLAECCRTFAPDWIMVRAADETFSHRSSTLLRSRLSELADTDAIMVSFPVVHLWRSKWWYRADREWGHSSVTHVNESCWRNDSGWEFVGGYLKARMHGGIHRPNKFSVPYKAVSANPFGSTSPFPVVVLHYGMSSHELVAKKLDFQLETADKVSGADMLPGTKNMPHPSSWHGFNGYKVGYEAGLGLNKVSQQWFPMQVPNEPKPEIKSLYDVVSKYNKPMAEEYAKIYGKGV